MKKKAVRILKKSLSKEDRQIRDEQNAEYISKVKKYFNVKYRGAYYSQMKHEVIKNLKQKRYSHQEIAEIIYGNIKRHDTISHMINKKKDIEDVETVRNHLDTWIEKEVYPATVYVDYKRKAYPHEMCDKDGFARVYRMTYTLLKKDEL